MRKAKRSDYKELEYYITICVDSMFSLQYNINKYLINKCKTSIDYYYIGKLVDENYSIIKDFCKSSNIKYGSMKRLISAVRKNYNRLLADTKQRNPKLQSDIIKGFKSFILTGNSNTKYIINKYILS